MADGPSFDFSEFDAVAADLGDVSGKSGPFIRKAAEVFGRNVKDAWREKVEGATALPRLAGAVSYDVKGSSGLTGSQVEIEIGYDKSRTQGPLGNVSEFGTPKVAPRGYGLAAFSENQEDLVRGVEAALADGRKAAGL